MSTVRASADKPPWFLCFTPLAADADSQTPPHWPLFRGHSSHECAAHVKYT
jgi:hypothetical protein